VRAETRLASEGDRRFYDHVVKCQNPSPCPEVPGCDSGKDKLTHYRKCTDAKCFHCVIPRLIVLRDIGQSDPQLEALVAKQKTDLTDSLRGLKKAADDYTEAKKQKTHSTEMLLSLQGRLGEFKSRYDRAKLNYELCCEQVYNKLKSAPASAATALPNPRPSHPAATTQPSIPRSSFSQQDAASTLSSLQASAVQSTSRVSSSVPAHGDTSYVVSTQTSRPSVVPPPSTSTMSSGSAPAASKKTVEPSRSISPTTGSSNSNAASGAKKSPTQPIVPPSISATPPANNPPAKKLGDEIDGNKIEYVVGDGIAAIVSKLERENESLTLSSTHKEDDWFTQRGLCLEANEKEPTWTKYNILNKTEIESFGLPAGKRLFSQREQEFISRACQEMMVDLVSECASLAKHRKLTTKQFVDDDNNNATIEITIQDVQHVLQKYPTASKALCPMHNLDGGAPNIQ
jgi:TAZ zinc finger